MNRRILIKWEKLIEQERSAFNARKARLSECLQLMQDYDPTQHKVDDGLWAIMHGLHLIGLYTRAHERQVTLLEDQVKKWEEEGVTDE